METNPNTRYDTLKEVVKSFPDQPGVYIMRDQAGEILYVGKAKILVNRVRSYFSGAKDIKTTTLLRRVDQIEHIITRSEYEALILENTLIKRHMPRFNISLKDGKSYPLIRITADPFPRVFKTRRIIQDGSEYFGPFANGRHAVLYLELIEKLFPLRKCAGKLKKRTVPCLYYHIGKCLGPCIGKATEEEYAKHVRKVKNLLSGRTQVLIQELQSEMRKASGELKFEVAAGLRDTIKAVEELQDKSSLVDQSEEQKDYISSVSEANVVVFCVFQMREGRLQGREIFTSEFFGTEDEAMGEFLLRYYDKHPRPKDSVYLSLALEVESLEQFFREDGRGDLRISKPEGGRHLSILRLAAENAAAELRKRLEGGGNSLALSDLQRVLGLDRLPKRIEGFDIAHVDGTDPVASLVSFWDGIPDKKNYRFFKLRSLKGAIDDFQSVKEAVARRYQRLVNEKLELPDLIMIDGGKGQISSAISALQALELKIPVCGLAKKNEEIFLPNRSDPIVLPQGSPALRVLQAVRDETHRFATKHNRRIRAVKLGTSLLSGISGMGPARSKKLLMTFKSLEALAQATKDEIAEKGKIPLDVAESVVVYLKDRETRQKTVKEIKRTRLQ